MQSFPLLFKFVNKLIANCQKKSVSGFQVGARHASPLPTAIQENKISGFEFQKGLF